MTTERGWLIHKALLVSSLIFFWLRVAHAIGMITGVARRPLPPTIFFANWIVTLVYAWQVLSLAPEK